MYNKVELFVSVKRLSMSVICAYVERKCFEIHLVN